MRYTTTLLLIGLMVSAAPTRALAQRRRAPARPAPARPAPPVRVPAAGDVAVGGSLGVTNPSHINLDNGLLLAGNVEKYLTPRLSVRGQVGAAWWDLTGFQRLTGSLQPFFVDGNVVYNWEHGVWHPYATGGIGMYRYGYSETPAPGGPVLTGSATKAGVDFGGGIEYFFAPRGTLTGELLIHKIGDVPTPGALFHTGGGSFWSIAGGVKKYF